ncbi:hypothetical protein NEMBOFW57_006670 [Staphylotrichum longicolle]|uniref:Uncharacterized protein n=1 Tax=Staphylotrichum longicolle TaxID=669026 RepID=A0AAD4EU11_9PEZI|nr:hypothetical protein NEMBOFW57_006670 [Staphylotrichum longicolle]
MVQDAPEEQTEGKTYLAHRLGALPSELFDKVLFNINAIRDLAHFITTARFVYRRFTIQKRVVLFRVLQNELGPVLEDARFLLIFPYSDPTDPDPYIDHLHEMAGVYHKMLQRDNNKNSMPVRGDALPSPEDLTGICRTLRQVNFIADMYIMAQLELFDNAGGGGTPATLPSSSLERRRLVRAFYRRQILSNAWAGTRRRRFRTHGETAAISNSSTHRGDRLGLFATLRPFELQQIDHVDVFITRLCLALLRHSPHMVSGSLEIPHRKFDDLFAHLDSMVRFLQTHREDAELAARDLARGMEPEHYAHLRSDYVNPQEMLPLRLEWQEDRVVSFPDPVTDKWEQDKLVMPYAGDRLDVAPYGWFDALRGGYTNWFGEGLQGNPWLPNWQSTRRGSNYGKTVTLWRIAGFALWDRERVEALKGLAVFGKLKSGWVIDPVLD